MAPETPTCSTRPSSISLSRPANEGTSKRTTIRPSPLRHRMHAIVSQLRHPSGRPLDRLVEDELGVDGCWGGRGGGEGGCGEREKCGESGSEQHGARRRERCVRRRERSVMRWARVTKVVVRAPLAFPDRANYPQVWRAPSRLTQSPLRPNASVARTLIYTLLSSVHSRLELRLGSVDRLGLDVAALLEALLAPLAETDRLDGDEAAVCARGSGCESAWVLLELFR